MSETLPAAFWSIPAAELLQHLDTTPQGLSSEEAQQRLVRHGPNLLKPTQRLTTLTLLLAQCKSPIVLLLLFAAGLSFFLHDRVDAVIIVVIILVSTLLGFWQESGAAHAVAQLLTLVQAKATVLRDGATHTVPTEAIVPGDVVILAAGSTIPGDCLILEAKDLFVNEAVLTGETYPVEKAGGRVLPADTRLGQRTTVLFQGTHIVSGMARALVVHTGTQTAFGAVAARLQLRPPETAFERGVRRFGAFLMELTLLLVLAIFAINVALAHPVMEAFLFALALAVGLTPQLLPAILSVSLAHGAKRMARQKVIVKRLAAIENFGSMDVLCADKTGTLTEGVMRVHAALDTAGQASEKALCYAYLNAVYQTGFTNPIDDALRTHCTYDLAGYAKLDEVPYDFLRKRLSILVAHDTKHVMITKGALPQVLAVCTWAETADGSVTAIAMVREQIQQHVEMLGRQGLRLLGVAYRDLGAATHLTKDHEEDMTFVGFVVFVDPPKPGIADVLAHLKRLGIALKIITGDSRQVATHVGQQVGLATAEILTGAELHRMRDEALLQRVREVEIFAEVEPNQKERLILALQKAGHVVGYMGDGINDASALHAADVGAWGCLRQVTHQVRR
jgi:Mg2+-importing ATPase